MRTLLFLGLLAALLGACLAINEPKASTEVSSSYSHVYDLMKEEFGGDYPIENLSVEIHDIVMRDGVTIRTRVYIPRDYQTGDKRSAILDRTPYGPFFTAMSLIWAFDGYVIVMQDQRGTFGSGGNFEIWRKDGQDAYDTSEWISQQEWSNGKVFSFGVSADACAIYPQILYNNPWLQAQFPIFGPDNGHALVYPGGVYLKNLVEGWLEDVCFECIEQVKEEERDGPFWDPVNMTSHYHNIHFPSVHWVGWYDIFGQPQLNAYDGYRNKAPEQYRDDAYLFVEPHGHCYDVVYPRGVSLLGLKLGRKIFQLQTTGVRDPLLDEVNNLNIFIMGPIDRGLLQPGNYFTSLDAWPTYTPTDYFLSPERTLDNRASLNNTAFTLESDPNDPAKTYGGNNLFGTCGPLDQTSVEARADVITFTTPSLLRNQAIVGPIRVVLFVSSTANDTDFLVRLTDVYPDGRSILLQEGSVRMKWRVDKRADPVLIVPGEIYEITVEVCNTALIFERGHSIRIAISNTNDPRFDPNPQNGLLLIEGGEKVVARNTIHVGNKYPSRLILPHVEESDIPPAAYNFW